VIIIDPGQALAYVGLLVFLAAVATLTVQRVYTYDAYRRRLAAALLAREAEAIRFEYSRSDDTKPHFAQSPAGYQQEPASYPQDTDA
jgi:hypothetical protein